MNAEDSARSERLNPLAPYLQLRSVLTVARSGDGGPEVCRSLTQAMDSCLTALAASMAPSQIAVVAVGGYGRSELCLYSDIDLMLLHTGRLPADAAEAVFYPLWNAGLKVGHAVRSVKEALTAASEHLETLTALLDARLVTGNGALLEELLGALGDRLRKGSIPLDEPLAQAEQARCKREPFQLLEPNVKDGRGGLRAFQSLHWNRRARVLAGLGEPPSVSKSDTNALATLLAFRNGLHAVVGRPYDVYAFDLWPSVATWLGLQPDMAGKRLYTEMRAVDTLVSAHWSADTSEPSVTKKGPPPLPLPLRLLKGGRHKEAQAPSDMPRPFASALVLAAQTLDRPARPRVFTPEEADLIRTRVSSGWDAADRAALIRLLAAGQRGWKVFTALEGLGWVGRVLPEWRHVVAAPQHTPFHLHPLDTHLWRTVVELLAISQSAGGEPWCPEVAAELHSLDDALLAALLHDIGKGWSGNHSITGANAVAALLRRAGFGPAQASIVTGAVRHHLLLPTIATRRDIDDPRVVVQVADHAGDLRLLRILYLLSVADARATGPTVWGPWKASLVRSLFSHAADELAQRSSRTSRPPVRDGIVQALKAAVAERVGLTVLDEHIQAMPPEYLSAFDLPDLVRHLDAMVPPPAPGEVVVNVRGGSPATDVIVVAEDRPGLLALISGVFALHNVSVLDGHFYTRADGIVLDSFHVDDALGNTIDDRRWSRVRADMTRALRGELALDELLREKVNAYRRTAASTRTVDVVVDTDAADSFTVVEIHCTDRIGLLHSIAGVLFELELDIRLAKIDTTGHQIVDTFYVCALDGGPVRDRGRLIAIKQQVRQRLMAGA